MREIVNICAGQCGINVGYRFWSIACEGAVCFLLIEVTSSEHCVDATGECSAKLDLQRERISVLFNEGPLARYVPRAVVVDLDVQATDAFKALPLGSLFSVESIVHGAVRFFVTYSNFKSRMVPVITGQKGATLTVLKF